MRRFQVLAATLCLAMTCVAFLSIGFCAYTVAKARRSLQRMPVLVVPGAVSGVYSPGLTEDNVRATGRYLTSLGTCFSGLASMDRRFDELEAFASAGFLPKLQAARATLRRDVETQSQARAFYSSPASERLDQTSTGTFEYSVHGERVVYASGLTMDTHAAAVRLTLLLGSPTDKNRTGILVDAFEVTDAPVARVRPPHV